MGIGAASKSCEEVRPVDKPKGCRAQKVSNQASFLQIRFSDSTWNLVRPALTRTSDSRTDCHSEITVCIHINNQNHELILSIETGRRVREVNQDSDKVHEDTGSDSILQKPRYEEELSVNTSFENRKGHIDSQTIASSVPYPCSTVPQASMIMNDPFIIADDMLSQQDPSWITMPAGSESRMPQPSFTPQSCSRNSTTGPCPGHFKKTIAHGIVETTSPLSLDQQHRNHHVPNSDISISPQPDQTPLSWSNFTGLKYVHLLFYQLTCSSVGLGIDSMNLAPQVLKLNVASVN